MNQTERRIEAVMAAAQAQVERILAEEARIATLPQEPEHQEGIPAVIWWQHQFRPGGSTYTYSAVRAEAHLGWYVTGSAEGAPVGGFSWEALLKKISRRRTDGTLPEIWYGTTWEQL